jgi:hypothetical protein
MIRARAIGWSISLSALGCCQSLCAQDAAPQEAVPLNAAVQSPTSEGVQAIVTTVDDERASGRITALADDKLQLIEPTRTIPLADVQRVEFGKSVASDSPSELSWIGQDNHDLVQVGNANGGNGIQDVHLHARGLKPQALKQLAVVCRLPKQLRVWRLDTSQSPHWRLAIAREDMAAEAEIYLEPPAGDSFGQKFEVTYTYNDGSTAKATVLAGTHTSDAQKVDRAVQPGQLVAPTAAAAQTSKADAYLADSGRLSGELVEMNAESVTLRTSWKADVTLPLVRVKGIWFGNSPPTGARAEFDKQLADPVGEDVVFLTAPDKTAAQIHGSVLGLSAGKLNVRFEGADRAVKQERVLGVVFAAHANLPAVTTPHQVFVFASGDTLSGRWLSLDGGSLEFETLWQARVKAAAADLAEIRSRNGRLTSLCDLEPASMEEVPYFGRVIHWRRDQGFDGTPATFKGKRPARWLAMHSHSVLTYALDGQFDKFKVTVGFDDSAGNRGRALCRVSVDGRELFVQKDFRSDQDPQEIELSVAGAKQIALEVGFGENQDVGDRIIWAEPRLFRAEAK